MDTSFDPDSIHPERMQILQSLKEALGDVSPTTWALFWLADLEQLQFSNSVDQWGKLPPKYDSNNSYIFLSNLNRVVSN